MEYYKKLFSGEILNFPRHFLNSVFIALVTSVFATIFSAGVGYVFARFRFRGRWMLLGVCLGVVLIPQQVLVLPLFTWMNTLGLLDNIWAVIFPGMVSGLGVIYFTFMFKKVPSELLDTARVEGAGEYRVFIAACGLLKSSMLTFGLILFVLSWHEHLIPMTMLTSDDQKTVPFALASLFGSSVRNIPYAIILIGSMFSIFPALAAYLALNRHFHSALADLVER